MSDQATTVVMMVFFWALAIGMSVVTTWFFVTHPRRIGRIQNMSAEIVAREEHALQRLATLLGALYTPGRTVDIPYGGSWPTAGTVDIRRRNLQVRVTFRIDNTAVDGPGESWYLPLVTIEVPQGARWVVEPKGRLLTKSIYGDEVRKRARPGHSADFRRAFGVREEALPPTTRPMLWSVGERSYKIEFSWRGVEIFYRPSDIVEHKGSFSQPTIWEGGYDVNELNHFIDQACALAVSLLVSTVAPGAIDAGHQ